MCIRLKFKNINLMRGLELEIGSNYELDVSVCADPGCSKFRDDKFMRGSAWGAEGSLGLRDVRLEVCQYLFLHKVLGVPK